MTSSDDYERRKGNYGTVCRDLGAQGRTPAKSAANTLASKEGALKKWSRFVRSITFVDEARHVY